MSMSDLTNTGNMKNVFSSISEIISHPDPLFASLESGANLIPTLLVVLAASLLFCFFGYRLFKLLVAVGGLYGGYFVGTLLSDLIVKLKLFEMTATIHWILVIVVAIIGGAIAFKLLKIGVVIGVAWIVHTALLPMLARPGVMEKIVELIKINISADIIAWVLGALVGLLALALMRPALILVTSFGGGLIAGQFGIALLGAFKVLDASIVGNTTIKLGLSIIIGLLGAGIQFRKKEK